MRVVVYGSASKDTPQAFKDASFELGKLLAQRGHICVNGGGNTGCMGSLSDGCLSHGGKVLHNFLAFIKTKTPMYTHTCACSQCASCTVKEGDYD